MDYDGILRNIHQACATSKARGVIASYIPELAQVPISKFGMHLVDDQMRNYHVGDAQEAFSIQSVSKVLSLAYAMKLDNEDVWNRMDVEPSGHPFNQLALLEIENGIPRNPFINAGALVIADILVSHLADPINDFLAYIRTLANDHTISIDTQVAKSERDTAHRNYAAAHLLKSYGNLKNEVDTVLDFYVHQCAIAMDCKQLTKAFYPFMNRGKCQQGNTYLNLQQVKRINALMLTCGFYDEAGEFAFEVGLPGKSGVGGGIVALLPGNFCVATWSPGLNEKGNSKLGMQALEQLTTATQRSIF